MVRTWSIREDELVVIRVDCLINCLSPKVEINSLYFLTKGHAESLPLRVRLMFMSPKINKSLFSALSLWKSSVIVSINFALSGGL